MIGIRRRASDLVPRNAATREADYRRDTAQHPRLRGAQDAPLRDVQPNAN